MNKLLLVVALCVPVKAERVSRAQPGTAPCGGDRAVRVLAIGGELQANSWCTTKEAKAAKRKAYEDKKKLEREEYKRKQEEERAKRKAAADAKRDADKKRREEERKNKKHDCRGVGPAAGCSDSNPGNGKAVGNKNK